MERSLLNFLSDPYCAFMGLHTSRGQDSRSYAVCEGGPLAGQPVELLDAPSLASE